MRQMTLDEFLEGMKVEANYSEETNILAGILNAYKNVPRETLRLLLSAKMGRQISDRKMRKLIENARQEGFVIANAQDGFGYYIPETYKELEILYRQNEHRALSILSQQKHIKKRMQEWTAENS